MTQCVVLLVFHQDQVSSLILFFRCSPQLIEAAFFRILMDQVSSKIIYDDEYPIAQPGPTAKDSFLD